MAQTAKFQTPANAPAGPPPLPPPQPPKRAPEGGAMSRLRAEIAIRWMHSKFWVRRHWIVSTALALVVVLGVAAGVYVEMEGLPDFGPFATATISDANANVREHPSDAAARRDLGHAQWAARRHHRALRSYARALSMDASIADDRMVDNLVAAFGTRERPEASSLIAKYKLVGAEQGLEKLTGSGHRPVRWTAARTLDKIGRTSKQSWETVLLLDLKSSECDVRREAVERLGIVGTRRILPALHAAAAADEKTGGWFRSRCLGEDRLKDTENKIQARK